MSDRSKRRFYARAWHGDEPYDEKEQVRLIKACEAIRRHAEAVAGGQRYDLLDVGCGVGPLRRWLPAEEFNIVGLEISPEAAEAARANYDACEVGDAESPWPLEADSFDGVHAGAVLEHVLDWHAPLNHANRVLRTRGLIVVSVPNLRYWKEIRRLIRGRQPHWLRSMGHIHGYTPRFLRELVTIHGFEVDCLEADRVNLPLMPRRNRWLERHFAGIGSVLILTAHLARRVRVEDRALAEGFARTEPAALRSIEVLEE